VKLSRVVPEHALHQAFVIAVAVGVILYYYLFWTSNGFKLRAVGCNMTASRFNGFPVKRYILASFIVSGAVAGLGGAAELLGTQFRLINGFGAGYGFDGVAMALIGQLHPIASMVVAIFFAALRTGSTTMQAGTGVPTSVSDIIQALVIVFTVAGMALVQAARVRGVPAEAVRRQTEGGQTGMSFISNLILASVRMAVPLLFIALAELYSERAGMVNIGLEGLAAIGSLIGFLVCFVTGSAWLGILCGALVGVAVNMIYAFATITLCANQIVYGMALNIFAPALASFIYRVYFGTGSELSQITLMNGVGIPGLKDIPFLGRAALQPDPDGLPRVPARHRHGDLLRQDPLRPQLQGRRRAPEGRRDAGHPVTGSSTSPASSAARSPASAARISPPATPTPTPRATSRARLHRAGRRHLRPLDRRRHPARVPVLRLLRRAADPPAGGQLRPAVPVLPDDPLRRHRRGPLPHRREEGRPARGRPAVPPRGTLSIIAGSAGYYN
jgi:ABC-type uncharacterized transport system permease subunit